MSDQTVTATPPADRGGNDIEAAVAAAVAKAMPEAIAAATKPLGDRLTAAEGNLKTVADTVASQKVLDAQAVQKLIEADATERAAATQKAAEAKAADDAKAAEAKAATEKFAAENLKGVPGRYHGDLGGDPAAWEAKAKAIREQFAADLAAAGVKVADVGGTAGGEAPAGQGSGGGFLTMPGGVAGEK